MISFDEYDFEDFQQPNELEPEISINDKIEQLKNRLEILNDKVESLKAGTNPLYLKYCQIIDENSDSSRRYFESWKTKETDLANFNFDAEIQIYENQHTYRVDEVKEKERELIKYKMEQFLNIFSNQVSYFHDNGCTFIDEVMKTQSISLSENTTHYQIDLNFPDVLDKDLLSQDVILNDLSMLNKKPECDVTNKVLNYKGTKCTLGSWVTIKYQDSPPMEVKITSITDLHIEFSPIGCSPILVSLKSLNANLVTLAKK